MRITLVGAGFLFLIGNEILSWMAILLISVAFIINIMKARMEK